ncbi:hypothetical protein ACN6K9_001679 [Streptomyces sp. SAS_267]|jgi:hypothetical protein|uniref:hypothetical protein n=1 Tax=Streptomyces sp. SAS_267 TaxID=3412750 RepID=UPI00403CFD19
MADHRVDLTLLPEAGPVVDWYGGGWKWQSPQTGLRAAVPLLAELAGAGVVGADAEDAYWRGASSEKDWDVSGNGRRVDVKRAWLHDDETLGFGGPDRGSYDEAFVDDILLLHLEDDDVVTDHEYGPGGKIHFEMTGSPRAAYRVPVAKLNLIMRRHGASKVRWLVRLEALAPFQVRGESAHDAGSPVPSEPPRSAASGDRCTANLIPGDK